MKRIAIITSVLMSFALFTNGASAFTDINLYNIEYQLNPDRVQWNTSVQISSNIYRKVYTRHLNGGSFPLQEQCSYYDSISSQTPDWNYCYPSEQIGPTEVCVVASHNPILVSYYMGIELKVNWERYVCSTQNW